MERFSCTALGDVTVLPKPTQDKVHSSYGFLSSYGKKKKKKFYFVFKKREPHNLP